MPTFKNFKDSRDGRIYKCVLMPDGKWWSAENLAWAGAGYDYKNNPAYRSIYGRYYDFGSGTSTPSLSTILPEGTHCPSVYEYWALVDACETRFSSNGTELFTTSKLRTVDQWKAYPWDGATLVPGLDEFGFALVPAGTGSYGPEWGQMERVTTLWTSDSQSTYSNYYCQITSEYGILNSYRATNNPMSIRFIVDEFPVEFPSQQITSISNLQISTANSQFRGESGLYRTLGSQGLPVVTANIAWKCTEDEALLFDGWFDPETPWTHENFPGLGDVVVQARGLPKKVRTYTGIEISLDVTLFFSASSTMTFPSFPTLVSYTGVESGYNFVDNQSVITTSGRTSLRTPTGKRGETYSISWKTSQSGAIQFLQWYISIGNGRKQFLASICGKVGWLWKIVQAPSFTLDVDMVKISMSVDGRDIRRGLSVSIVKGW